jgi:hypothetical protein
MNNLDLTRWLLKVRDALAEQDEAIYPNKTRDRFCLTHCPPGSRILAQFRRVGAHEIGLVSG